MMASCIAQHSMKVSGWCSYSTTERATNIKAVQCLQHAREEPLWLQGPTPTYHVDFRNVQPCHQRSNRLPRRRLAVLECACLMLQVLCKELLEVVQLERARLAQASCMPTKAQQVRWAQRDAHAISNNPANLGLPASAMTPMQWLCSLRQPASSLSRGSQLQQASKMD